MKPSIFQLIDLDRTLFDTVGFINEVLRKVNMLDPELGAQLGARFEASYNAERTFFVLRYLREKLGDETLERFVAEVAEEHRAHSFLLRGAKERLREAHHLSRHQPSHGIMTYGDEIDQLLKIRIAGLGHLPVYVTETPNKSALMKSWQQADGTFRLPDAFGGGIVEQLVLEDDKLRAFTDLPEGALGIWITDDEDPHHRLEEAQVKVIPVRDLHESIDVLKTTYL